MRYYEIDFTISPCSQEAKDILAVLAGDAGCESFEETEKGLKAYIQQPLYDEEAFKSMPEFFLFPDCKITFKVCEAEYRDWNEQWEQEGFEPIIISGEGQVSRNEQIDTIIIHDGRHLPENLSADTSSASATTNQIAIEIDAHQAFGTGTHETTRMICAELLNIPLEGRQVLDCGCGTGILGICALKLGAAACVGYDIDEWSADNTRHNAILNHVDDNLTVLCGDASLLATLPASLSPSSASLDFSLIMANINRNILLQDLPSFVSVMSSDATLILSGFYESDCQLLEGKALSLGLRLSHTRTDGDWACMVFKK